MSVVSLRFGEAASALLAVASLAMIELLVGVVAGPLLDPFLGECSVFLSHSFSHARPAQWFCGGVDTRFCGAVFRRRSRTLLLFAVGRLSFQPHPNPARARGFYLSRARPSVSCRRAWFRWPGSVTRVCVVVRSLLARPDSFRLLASNPREFATRCALFLLVTCPAASAATAAALGGPLALAEGLPFEGAFWCAARPYGGGVQIRQFLVVVKGASESPQKWCDPRMTIRCHLDRFVLAAVSGCDLVGAAASRHVRPPSVGAPPRRAASRHVRPSVRPSMSPHACVWWA